MDYDHTHDGFAGTGGAFDHAAIDAGFEKGVDGFGDDSFLVGSIVC